MYIVKPQKGFVIPVEYMVNEKLYDDSLKSLRYEERDTEKAFDDTEINKVTVKKDEIVKDKQDIYESVISGRLFDDDDFDEDYDNSVITAILEDKGSREEDNSGMLVFDDVIENNNLVFDENKAIQLDNARGNLRKAIEVEIEKVGKLVLDDSETEIDSKVSVKSADVEIDDGKDDGLEENIVTDEAREEKEEKSEEDVLEIADAKRVEAEMSEAESDDLENIVSDDVTSESSISKEKYADAENVSDDK